MEKRFICGSENEPILLNKIMNELVEKNVKNFKEDLNLDFELLKSNGKEHKSFIWFNRESGTDLMIEKFIPVIYTFHNVTFNTFANYKMKVYRIIVTKICPKNIYGYIEEINFKKYFKEVKEQERKYEKVKVRITLNDKTVKELEVPFTDNCYRETLFALKLENEDLKNFEYLAFS